MLVFAKCLLSLSFHENQLSILAPLSCLSVQAYDNNTYVRGLFISLWHFGIPAVHGKCICDYDLLQRHLTCLISMSA